MKTIRNLFLVGAMSGAVALGGCASIGGGTGTTAANITTVISQVQQASVAACAFLPTTATVAQIIGTAAGVGVETTLATTIAAQICAAVSPTAKARRGGAAPTVNGVTIHGRFVN
jgi:hypothetical protein